MPAIAQLPYTTVELQKVPAEITESGACTTGVVPAVVFDGETAADIAAAKAVCIDCIVRTKCLAYAVANEGYGVWGATTPEERKQLRGRTKLVTPEDRRDSDAVRQALLRHDRIADIARRFGVVERTVYRWKKRWTEQLVASGDAETLRKLNRADANRRVAIELEGEAA